MIGRNSRMTRMMLLMLWLTMIVIVMMITTIHHFFPTTTIAVLKVLMLFLITIVMMIGRKRIIVMVAVVVVGRTLKRCTICRSGSRGGCGGTRRRHRGIGSVVVSLVLITITITVAVIVTPTNKTTFDSITDTFYFHRADQTSGGGGDTQSICVRSRNNGILMSSMILVGTLGIVHGIIEGTCRILNWILLIIIRNSKIIRNSIDHNNIFLLLGRQGGIERGFIRMRIGIGLRDFGVPKLLFIFLEDIGKIMGLCGLRGFGKKRACSRRSNIPCKAWRCHPRTTPTHRLHPVRNNISVVVRSAGTGKGRAGRAHVDTHIPIRHPGTPTHP
mmetsp:Transcript_26383/g.30401  ORF Transcript_26383/g.30401 Transcript_26383/m.30401 type:complete len:330 (+) Transcript_26383:164-1153(+)